VSVVKAENDVESVVDREHHEASVRKDRVVSERREANAVPVHKASVHHGPRGSVRLVHRESERHAAAEPEVLNRLNSRRKLQ
jgi:hypothetical protein